MSLKALDEREVGSESKGGLLVQQWERTFGKLKAYAEAGKSVNISKRNAQTQEERALASWTSRQRAAFRSLVKGERTSMTMAKVARLRAIGIELSNKEELVGGGFKTTNPWIKKGWESKYQLLVRFKRVHGHVTIGNRFSTDEYPGLGRWLHFQRLAWNRQTEEGTVQRRKGISMTKAQAEKLEELGVSWARAQKDRGEDPTLRKVESSNRIANWEKNFERLKDFYVKDGTFRPGRADDRGFRGLRQWVNAQKQAHRNEQKRAGGEHPKGEKRITQRQISRLIAIGFQSNE